VLGARGDGPGSAVHELAVYLLEVVHRGEPSKDWPPMADLLDALEADGYVLRDGALVSLSAAPTPPVVPSAGTDSARTTLAHERTTGVTSSSGRSVFLVHGRDIAARDELIKFLRALDLKIINWREAAAAAGGGTPYTGDIVIAGLTMADAIVVLLTPDDVGYVRVAHRSGHDGPDELEPTGQARLNVIFEAGMAMALARERVVVVEMGAVRAMSDTAGLNVVRLRDSIDSRRDLAGRLRSAGLAADTADDEWRTAGVLDRPALARDDLNWAPAP
jgi:predicted nucleotide-binding protein